jgi:hypothetical protein
MGGRPARRSTATATTDAAMMTRLWISSGSAKPSLAR